MKYIILILALILLTVSAHAADTWYKGTIATFAWDAVTAYEDGTPIVVGEIVTYKIYVKNDKTGAEILIGSATETQSPVVVPSRGWWRFGTQATIEPDVSTISWSSSAVVCLEGQTFGLRYLFPGDPKNLRKVDSLGIMRGSTLK